MIYAMIARALGSISALRGLLPLALLLPTIGCDKVPLTAPTESTIQLFATATSLPATGSTDIVATVTESAGTPVQNGTVVSFTTTLGRIEPSEARTQNGKVTVKLTGDGRSGLATITAFSGAAVSDPPLELPIGSAAADSLTLRAEPGTLPPGGGSTDIIALVRNDGGDPVQGATVAFSTTAGTLSSGTAVTDANGEARTTLTASREATVTARAGAQSSDITVAVEQALGLSVTASPASPTAGQPVTFSITVDVPDGGNPARRVEIDFGDGESRSLNVASSGGTTTVAHTYEEDGTFTVRVRAIDSAGAAQTQDLIIAVLPGMTVTLTASDTTPATGQSVTLTAVVIGGTATVFEWTFGDGSAQTTATGSTTHSYTSTGSKTVRVRALAADGAETDDDLVVTVH